MCIAWQVSRGGQADYHPMITSGCDLEQAIQRSLRSKIQPMDGTWGEKLQSS